MVRTVPLSLGGRERNLRFALSAWAALEDHGTDMQAATHALRGSGKPPSMKSVALLLWSMLQEDDDPKTGVPPTIREVRSWVDGDNFAEVMSKVGDALRLAFPPKPEEPVADPPPGVGTGSAPSASPTAPSASLPTSSGA